MSLHQMGLNTSHAAKHNWWEKHSYLSLKIMAIIHHTIRVLCRGFIFTRFDRTTHITATMYRRDESLNVMNVHRLRRIHDMVVLCWEIRNGICHCVGNLQDYCILWKWTAFSTHSFKNPKTLTQLSTTYTERNIQTIFLPHTHTKTSVECFDIHKSFLQFGMASSWTTKDLI